MSEQKLLEQWETYVQEAAGAFIYPPTPDMVGAVRNRLAAKRPPPPSRLLRRQRLALAAAIGVIIFGLATMPPVRAKVLEMVGLGTGRVLLAEPTPTLIAPTLTVTGLPDPTSMLLTATPQPSSTPLSSIQERVSLPLQATTLSTHPEAPGPGTSLRQPRLTETTQ